MKYIVNNLRLSLDDGIEEIKEAAASKLGIGVSRIEAIRIAKESVDARRKPRIAMVYSVEVETCVKAEVGNADVRELAGEVWEETVPGDRPLNKRPVVIGTGPAGIFAGLVLAQQGYAPIVLERGERLERRTELVKKYWETGVLDTESNVQFGEGGAGTFSDGKLTTRINDRRCEKVLAEFHRSGAPGEILIKARPHIGTDHLKKVVVDMRRRIEALGGELRFNSRVTSLRIKNGRVSGVIINGGEELETEVVVLAVGHSARDTYRALISCGVAFDRKPFSIGARVEHPQELIDRAQYGAAAGHSALGAADYQLFRRLGGRTVYSFCMCPGGIVTASASEQDTIVTNGMSEYARDRENANSALVVSVEPGDFGEGGPLAGVEFQRRWESLAFRAGGGDGAAPVQRLGDFLLERPSVSFGSVKPSYTGRTRPSDLQLCLPAFVTGPMREAIVYFNTKIRGFNMKDALLTGVETRTSSPVRLPREDSLEARGIGGLYPAGEGAGYAGGIMSAAVDGIRVAERIVRTYARPWKE